MKRFKAFRAQDGRLYRPVSRWIRLRSEYITPRHSLWDYAEHNEGVLYYFEFRGRKYALGQFMSFSYPILYEDKDGKLGIIGGYDCTEAYFPLLLEIHPDGEAVKLFIEEADVA